MKEWSAMDGLDLRDKDTYVDEGIVGGTLGYDENPQSG
jgi:hypothetical protein